MPKTITRKVALERGLPRYFSGKPCPKGHIAERTAKGATCVECTRDRGRVNTLHDSLEKRKQNLKQRYGLSIEDFIVRVERQRNRCALCSNLSQKLVVDHCHARKKVRELLCERCNRLLGTAEDSLEILQSAIDYLVKHS
jgi:hypothetical protein